MIVLAAFLLGGAAGVLLWLYVTGFIERLQQDIHATYVELFPQNPPIFQPHFAAIQPKKCGQIWRYFCLAGSLLACLQIYFNDDLFTLWIGSTLLILWAISYLDWHYQLISPTPCLWLLALGLFGAQNGFSAFTLAESLQSAAGFFLVFYGIYWLAKAYYKQEAFGRGDYWLALGLGSFLPLENLPHFLLLACMLGIGGALILRKTKGFLPFGPFMCASVIALWTVHSL